MHGVIFVAVDEKLVEGLGDEIVLIVVRAEQAERIGLDLQFGGVAADRVIPDPQLGGGHARSLQAFEQAEVRVLGVHEGGS
jgi:hypothetical protein